MLIIMSPALENSKLNDLMFYALDHGVSSINEGGPLIPFVVFESNGARKISRFVTQPYEVSVEKARNFILTEKKNIDRYALAFDGFVTPQGIKYDAILVQAGEKGSNEAMAVGIRYKPKTSSQKFETIGNPILFPAIKNPLVD